MQREAREERKKYLLEKTKFTKIEQTINEKIAQLEKDKNKVLNKFDEGLLEARSAELKQTVEEYQLELTQLGQEISMNNQLIKEKSNLISNYIKKIPKKSISIYNTLRKNTYLAINRLFMNYQKIKLNLIGLGQMKKLNQK